MELLIPDPSRPTEGSGGESKIANPKSKMKQMGDPGCELSRPALRYHKPVGKRTLTRETWPDPLGSFLTLFCLPRTTCREPPGRTTERLGRESRDEPRSKFATREPCVACPEQLERGECSELPGTEAHQSHGRKYVARGLPIGLGSWKGGNEQVSGPLVGPRSELPVGRSG